ncbi:MAG: hypothetical protein L0229_08610 [Blastocatellia bacterium]|nr:hypothetical protein [Blastocatellia bacterium]
MKKLCLAKTFLIILALTFTAHAQSISFDSTRWEIDARESRVMDHLGRKALLLKGGIATVKDSRFTDGIIEFDIAFTGERGFMGAIWRVQDSMNYEEFYVRPHMSGNADANQYTPVFNGVSAWQLYHGEGYGAPVVYDFNQWIHVKIVVSGNNAEVYIKDMEKPALFVNELKHLTKSGRVGLSAGNFAPAYFSNFSFTAMNNPPLKGKASEMKAPPEGTIAKWMVSNTFDEKSLDKKYALTRGDKENLKWKELACESSGTVNLARLQGISEGKDTAFARVTILSANEQVKKLRFGFSDRVKVYFNDRLIYGGTNLYQSRDYRFLGTIGYFDELYLPLKKGENELWIAVSESFGGWGIKAMFEDMEGIEIKE